MAWVIYKILESAHTQRKEKMRRKRFFVSSKMYFPLESCHLKQVMLLELINSARIGNRALE